MYLASYVNSSASGVRVDVIFIQCVIDFILAGTGHIVLNYTDALILCYLCL